MDILVHLFVDSKDLFTSFYTQRNSIDRSIHGDVACIRFEFQVGNLQNICWIPEKFNVSDPLTKKDTVITDAQHLTIFIGNIKVTLQDLAETKSAVKNLG